VTTLPSLEQQADAILARHHDIPSARAVHEMVQAIEAWLERRASVASAGVEPTERDARRMLFEAMDRARFGRSTG
jgi:hypothetical protein